MEPQPLTKRTPFNLRDLCQIGVFTAVIAVMAQIAIPTPSNVPFTLQTFAIALAGVILGPRKGAAGAALYVLLAAIGVPVLAGFTGGLGNVLGVTCGFIISFPLLALAAGLGAKGNKISRLILGLAAGVLVNYLCGMLLFSLLTASDLALAFTLCVLPFIPTDIVKMIVIVLFGKKIRGTLHKSGVLS